MGLVRASRQGLEFVPVGFSIEADLLVCMFLIDYVIKFAPAHLWQLDALACHDS